VGLKKSILVLKKAPKAAMVGSQTVFSILDEAPAAIEGWSAAESIRCVHLDSEAVAVAPSLLELEGALLKRDFPGSIRLPTNPSKPAESTIRGNGTWKTLIAMNAATAKPSVSVLERLFPNPEDGLCHNGYHARLQPVENPVTQLTFPWRA
jgi:hypothetical protein